MNGRILLSVALVLCLAAGGSVLAAGKQEAPKPGEVVTLSTFSMPANKSGLQEGWWADILKEKVGVQIELMPSGDQGEQKLQALMAAGELPDVVVFKDKKQVEDAIRARLLVSLDDNLAKLPNVAKNAATALKYYRDSASAGTGKAYAIPNGIGPGEVGDEINWGPFLRWDLYKKLGMPELSTVEDYLPLLKKMQDMQPTNADGQKVYGISMWKDWDNYTMHQAMQPSVLAGVDTGDQLGSALPFLQVDLSTGATKSILDPSSYYLRALKFYYTANQMGLVDPDSLTQRFDTALAKAEQGRILFAWWPWFVGNYNKPSNTNADSWSGFRPVLPKDYKAFWWGTNPVGSSWPFAIGASTKHLDAALRYVDFMYSMDGLTLLMNGPKGVTWDLDSNGKPAITANGWDIIENQKDLPAGGKIGDGVAVVNSYGLSGATINPATGVALSFGYWPSSKGRNPTNLLKDWQKTTGYKTTSEMLWARKMYTLTPLAMRMVPVVPDDIQQICSRIGDVVKTTSWQMVFAKNDAEYQSLLADMTSKATGLGLQQVLDWDAQAWQKAQDSAKHYQ
ncbi:MAG TPA: extracellular solute-binding protein [Spirochaetia bacterium]|nr:extracellular solute-binding protein [Spirochaetia bacterium]